MPIRVQYGPDPSILGPAALLGGQLAYQQRQQEQAAQMAMRQQEQAAQQAFAERQLSMRADIEAQAAERAAAERAALSDQDFYQRGALMEYGGALRQREMAEVERRRAEEELDRYVPLRGDRYQWLPQDQQERDKWVNSLSKVEDAEDLTPMERVQARRQAIARIRALDARAEQREMGPQVMEMEGTRFWRGEKGWQPLPEKKSEAAVAAPPPPKPPDYHAVLRESEAYLAKRTAPGPDGTPVPVPYSQEDVLKEAADRMKMQEYLQMNAERERMALDAYQPLSPVGPAGQTMGWAPEDQAMRQVWLGQLESVEAQLEETPGDPRLLEARRGILRQVKALDEKAKPVSGDRVPSGPPTRPPEPVAEQVAASLPPAQAMNFEAELGRLYAQYEAARAKKDEAGVLRAAGAASALLAKYKRGLKTKVVAPPEAKD